VFCTFGISVIFADGAIRSDDGILHIYRAFLVKHSIFWEGVFYPRFTSGLAFGYGAGLFNFFSPFAYYPVATLQTLSLSLESSWTIALAIYLLFAQATAYLLGKDITGSIVGGFIVAIAYSASPYLLLNLTSRGSVTELASLAVLPLVLLFCKKLILNPKWRNFVGFSASVALFVPMHNIITIHSLVIAVPWAIFWTYKCGVLLRLFYFITFAVLVSFFATAFFWLPALGETKDVKLNSIAAQLDFIDATKHLRPVYQVIELGSSADQSQLQAETPISLSLFLLVLTTLGLGLKQSKNFRGLLLMLLTVALTCVWLNTPLSIWVWQNVPLLNYSQFAWRILGVASLALALAAGLSFVALYNSLQSSLGQKLLFWVVSFGILLGGYPWFYRPKEAGIVSTIQEIHAFEEQTNQLVLSSYSEYLPVAARNLSRTSLARRFDESLVIARTDPSAEVIQATWSSLEGTLVINTASPTRLVLDWLYMPGWSVSINQQPANAYAEESSGLLAVDIPSGESLIHIRRILTPLQQLGTGLSLVAIFLAAPLAWLIAPSARPLVRDHSSPTGLAHVVVLGLIFIAFRLVVDISGSSIFKLQRWQDESFQAENLHDARLANGMTLLASTETDRSSGGQALQIETFWSIYQPSLERDYSLIYQLVNPQGLVVAEENRFLIGQLPTSHWLENHYIQDKLRFFIPPHTPPGELLLRATVYDSQTLAPISWLNEQGNPQGASFNLDRVILQENARRLNFSQPTDEAIISLVELSGLPDKAQAGDELILSWLWRLNRAATANYSARLIWTCDDGKQAESDWVELVHSYPVNRWQTGDTWRDTHRFYVPGQLQTSLCSVYLAVQDSQQKDFLSFDIGSVTVQAPTRIYQIDEVYHPQNIGWQNGIQLAGYSRQGQELKLFWSSSQPIRQSLRLFIQALSPDGQVLWQVDEIPRQWSRPTTSWDVAEIITTSHIVDIPVTDGVSVIVGWYDPISGLRILLSDSTEDYAVMSFSTP